MSPEPIPRRVILVENRHSGRGGRHNQDVAEALRRAGFVIVCTLPVDRVAKLATRIEESDGSPILVVASGGDGTVGAVVEYVVQTPHVLGVLPFGTSNDVARTLGIPLDVDTAIHTLAGGKISTVDVGELRSDSGHQRYFVHAAAIGLDVAFARLATRTSLRKRLGRFTYVAAALLAIHNRKPFTSALEIDGRTEEVCLIHLSVVNAPVFGGFLGLRIPGASVDDRKLDILAVSNVGPCGLILALGRLLFRHLDTGGDISLYHAKSVHVRSEQKLDVSLDGEVCATVPGDFVLVPDGLRVVTPTDFEDVDDT